MVKRKSLEKYNTLFSEISKTKKFHAQTIIKKYNVSRNLTKALKNKKYIKDIGSGVYKFVRAMPNETEVSEFLNHIAELSRPKKESNQYENSNLPVSIEIEQNETEKINSAIEILKFHGYEIFRRY